MIRKMFLKPSAFIYPDDVFKDDALIYYLKQFPLSQHAKNIKDIKHVL